MAECSWARRAAVPQESDAEPIFHRTNSVARNGELGVLGIFERENDLTCKPCIHFVNPVDIHKSGAVNAEELCGIEPPLQLGDGLVDAMAVPIDNCICELVLGDEMSHVAQGKKRYPLAYT